MKRSLLWIGVGLLAATVAFGSLIWRSVAQSRQRDEPLGQIPDFQLPAATAAGSGKLSLGDLAGSFWVADFVFIRCGGPCPMMTKTMAGLQKTLPPEIKLVTFTVDPDRDTLEDLTSYARRYEADPVRWQFLRADKGELYRLVYNGFQLPMMEDPDAPSGFRVTHSTKFVLVDGSGAIRGYFDSSEPDLADQIRRAVTRFSRKKA